MPFNSTTAKIFGAKGGRSTRKKMTAKDPDYYSTIGAIGGKKMLKERGREFFSRMGAMSPYKKDLLKAKMEEDGQS